MAALSTKVITGTRLIFRKSLHSHGEKEIFWETISPYCGFLSKFSHILKAYMVSRCCAVLKKNVCSDSPGLETSSINADNNHSDYWMEELCTRKRSLKPSCSSDFFPSTMSTSSSRETRKIAEWLFKWFWITVSFLFISLMVCYCLHNSVGSSSRFCVMQVGTLILVPSPVFTQFPFFLFPVYSEKQLYKREKANNPAHIWSLWCLLMFLYSTGLGRTLLLIWSLVFELCHAA